MKYTRKNSNSRFLNRISFNIYRSMNVEYYQLVFNKAVRAMHWLSRTLLGLLKKNQVRFQLKVTHKLI